VKKKSKSVNICRSYGQLSPGSFLCEKPCIIIIIIIIITVITVVVVVVVVAVVVVVLVASGCVVECRFCNWEVCRFESRPGLLRTKVYSAFHPSAVGKWVPVIAGKAKRGMAHSDCGWTCGCAGKTVRSLENMYHTWALLRWWSTTKRRYIKCMHLYLYLTFSSSSK